MHNCSSLLFEYCGGVLVIPYTRISVFPGRKKPVIKLVDEHRKSVVYV